MLMSAEASMRHSRARIYPLTAQRARGPTTYLDVCGANDSRPHGRGATFPARPSFGSKPPPFNHMRPMRLTAAALLLVAEALAAQQPRQLTADDYARAERALAPAVAPLVSGLAGRATWLADGRFWYRATVPNGSAFFVVDPARRTREALFDATRLATALAAASGGHVDANRLPFQSVDLAKDNRAITVSVRNRRWSCDLQQYTCAPADSTSGGAAAPQNSSVSPDGRTAVFIKDYNLYAKDLASGRETQLTTDGVKDFGYATDNAGWVHSDRPIVSWSPDSRQLATYQQDERGTHDMYLVAAQAGAPKLEAWKYPLPGDSVIFRRSE